MSSDQLSPRCDTDREVCLLGQLWGAAQDVRGIHLPEASSSSTSHDLEHVTNLPVFSFSFVKQEQFVKRDRVTPGTQRELLINH